MLFARIALERNAPQHAALLLGASDALREQVGLLANLLEWPPRSETLAATRRALGDDAFSQAWTAGHALSYEQAAAAALRPEPPTTTLEPETVPEPR